MTKSLDLIISQMPTIILQGLHIGIVQEMWFCERINIKQVGKGSDGEEELQQEYTTAL
jgi:hypothetical protein